MAKVFVGNIPFALTDEGLRNLFSQAGTVTSAVVITRGRRSLGYGFVDFEKLDDANVSIKQFNQSDQSGRTIKVELARPPKEKNESEEKPRKPKVQKKKTRKPKGGQQKQSDNQTPQTNKEQSKTDKKPKQPKKKKEKKPEGDRVQSKTILYVSNLPFSFTDEDLLEAFKQHNAKKANVVRKVFYKKSKQQTTPGRSRGYGFVEFDDESDQVKALEAMKGYEVNDKIADKPARKLQVAISYAVIKEENEKDEKGEKTEAAPGN